MTLEEEALYELWVRRWMEEFRDGTVNGEKCTVHCYRLRYRESGRYVVWADLDYEGEEGGVWSSLTDTVIMVTQLDLVTGAAGLGKVLVDLVVWCRGVQTGRMYERVVREGE